MAGRSPAARAAGAIAVAPVALGAAGSDRGDQLSPSDGGGRRLGGRSGWSRKLGADLPPLVGLASLAWVAAMRGNDDEASRLAERVMVGAQHHGLSLPVGIAAAAMMELDLARGKIESATSRATGLARLGSDGCTP